MARSFVDSNLDMNMLTMNIRERQSYNNSTPEYFEAVKYNIEDTRGKPEELLATRNKCTGENNRTSNPTTPSHPVVPEARVSPPVPRVATPSIDVQEYHIFLDEYHTFEREARNTGGFVSDVFKLYTDTFADDTCVYGIHDEKCIQRQSSEYHNTIKFNIEATRGRPEVLLETRDMCTESCLDVLDGKPKPIIKYQLTDRYSVIAQNPQWETVYCPFVESYNRIINTSSDCIADIVRLYQQAFPDDSCYYDVLCNVCTSTNIDHLEDNVKVTMGRPFDLLEYRLLCEDDCRLGKEWSMEMVRHTLHNGDTLCMPRYSVEDDATVFDNPSFYKRVPFMKTSGRHIKNLFRDFPSVCTIITHHIKSTDRTVEALRIPSVIEQLDAANCTTRFALITLSVVGESGAAHAMVLVVDFESKTFETIDPIGQDINDFILTLDRFGYKLCLEYVAHQGTYYHFVICGFLDYFLLDSVIPQWARAQFTRT
ncbi:hypothetical protein SARC_04456 [Sphaeroforma arctica JP610]|uniref:Uncharacterized protein n=1 Tax=Sphaeroforma arctica JP610 TaxID=667725 RepID=A0A0L0G2J6_9EUKA|nr:hypothetical protein SARC_04456 [Sphaeroforma arctica JP610]KNC83295.1 hypothetical protein SARC_04456 [Sphaeroforma arctica JP610]|eukprot:XP_014157197.1 hypothetical protein SARC_04456 [Sphaeroforma arctica JP610]